MPPYISASPLAPVILGDEPVATTIFFASKTFSPEQKTFFASPEKSTFSTTAFSMRAPNFCACSRIFQSRSKPLTPSGNPGKFSTSLVVVSNPPGCAPSMTSGDIPARAAYMAAPIPAQPLPIIIISSIIGKDDYIIAANRQAPFSPNSVSGAAEEVVRIFRRRRLSGGVMN